MTIRQLRLGTPEQIRKRSKDLTGKKINIVLCNRTVLFGELKMVNDKELAFVNMRQEDVSLALKDISEVYLDFKE